MMEWGDSKEHMKTQIRARGWGDGYGKVQRKNCTRTGQLQRRWKVGSCEGGKWTGAERLCGKRQVMGEEWRRERDKTWGKR